MNIALSFVFLIVSLHPIQIQSFVFSTKNRRLRCKGNSLNLFYDTANSPEVREQIANDPSMNRISPAVIDSLKRNPNLPFDFHHGHSKCKKDIRVRFIEKKDLNAVVQLCLREYGSYSVSNTFRGDPISSWIKDKMNDFDNFLFSFVVLLGLGQRVERREQSNTDTSIPQDHNVICISELDIDGNERIFGMAEISLQIPDPSKTSPPFVIPPMLKKVLGYQKPYISNVLITNEFRGNGYSKVLIAVCEGIATQWGFDEVYLHVDANSSGTAAQNLYISNGYRPVINEQYNRKFEWMGIESINRGLYIVDGVALLFLKKSLSSSSNST